MEYHGILSVRKSGNPEISNLLLSEHTEIADVFPPIYLYDFLPYIILTD